MPRCLVPRVFVEVSPPTQHLPALCAYLHQSTMPVRALAPVPVFPLASALDIDHDLPMIAIAQPEPLEPAATPSHPPPPSPSPLPALSAELRALLSRFVALSFDAHALADERNQDVFDLLCMLADPAAAAWLAHFEMRAAQRRRELALKALESICTKSPDPIEQRRAATRLLRDADAVTRPPAKPSTRCSPHARPHQPHTHSPDESTPPPAPRADARSLALTRPNPTLSAQQTLATLLQLITEKSESILQSRATLNAFFHRRTCINNTQVRVCFEEILDQFANDPNFQDLALLTTPAKITPHAPTLSDSEYYQQAYTFTTPTRTLTLRFTLYRLRTGWMIEAIQTVPP